MNKLNLNINGMHCRSCEILIEENLKKINGVKSANVDYKKGTAEITYSEKPKQDELEKAVYDAGYHIGEKEKEPLLSSNKNDYKDLGIAFLSLVVLYFILKGLGLTEININAPANPSSLGVVLLVGLVAGFSTCMALIGGLTLGLSAKHAEKHPEATPSQKFRPHLFFNIGRIGGYAFFGGILGSLGSVFQLSTTTMGILTVVVGLVMLLVGLQLIEIFPRLNSWKLTLPKSVSKLVGINKHQREYSHKNSMMLGGMTFFLPCGFTQAMQLFAVSTGDFLQGSLVMGLFALGTAPGLLSIGGLTSIVKGQTAKRFFKFAGIIVIFLSFFNIANGYNLTGWEITPALSQSKTAAIKDPNVKMKDGVQVVSMVENNRGYSPNKFTIQKGIPVRWEIDAQAPYSCASALVVNKLNIRKNLKKGLNVIEFTPKTAGKIPFSCSMGMYTGSFTVVDGEVAATEDLKSEDDDQPAATGTCGTGSKAGGCGGCGGGKKLDTNTTPKAAIIDKESDEQIIKTVYTAYDDIQPNTFTVKAGQPVRFEVDAEDDGAGCMSQIMVPGLYDTPELLTAGETIVMTFTPEESGEYDITCAMGMTRGKIIVE